MHPALRTWHLWVAVPLVGIALFAVFRDMGAVSLQGQAIGQDIPSGGLILNDADSHSVRTLGTWRSLQYRSGYLDDLSYATVQRAPAIPAALFQWRFSTPEETEYQVYLTWPMSPITTGGRGVPLIIGHGTGEELRVAVDQHTVPRADLQAARRSWQLLGTVRSVQRTVTVSVSNAATGGSLVFADAVMIVPAPRSSASAGSVASRMLSSSYSSRPSSAGGRSSMPSSAYASVPTGDAWGYQCGDSGCASCLLSMGGACAFTTLAQCQSQCMFAISSSAQSSAFPHQCRDAVCALWRERAFDMMDTDGDRLLTVMEAQQAVTLFHAHWTTDNVRSDFNGNGVIDPQDFETLLWHVSRVFGFR